MMKKTLALAAVVIGFGANASAATVTGVISDAMCGKSHAAMTEHGTKMTDKQCTQACVEHGSKYVLVEGDKVLNIANQDFKDLKAFAGDKVTVTGDIKGDTVTVTKLQKAK